jgi:hypothetical protein
MTVFASAFGGTAFFISQVPTLRKGLDEAKEVLAETTDKWSRTTYRWKRKILGLKKTELRLMTEDEVIESIGKK